MVRAWQQAKSREALAYHPGARLVFSDGTPDILAYPQTAQGWGQLCRMLTAGNRARREGRLRPDLATISRMGRRLSLAIVPDRARDAERNRRLSADQGSRRLAGRFGWPAPAYRRQ